MDTIKYLLALAVGLLCVIGPGWDLLEKWRRRRHYRRVPGVIVGLRDTRGEAGPAPSTRSRAAIFRFTTLDGRVITTESNVQSFPGPRPGKRVTVLYDPRRPYSAETTGRFVITVALMPPLMAFGVFLLATSVPHLL